VEEAPTMHWDVGISSPEPRSGRGGLRRACGPVQLVATFVQLEDLNRTRSVGRSAPGHRQVVRHLLEQASRRRGEKERDG
jgi:hypothetical protein